MQWTTRSRADALNAFWEQGGLEIDGHEVVRRKWRVNLLESVIHELAHAVCLNLDPDKHRLSDRISERLVEINKKSDRAWMWQEIMALAVEVLVLKELRIAIHRVVVSGAAERESYYPGRVFDRLVAVATTTQATRRRAREVRRLLDALCKEGRCAQLAHAMR